MFMALIYIRVRINPNLGPPGSGTSFREKLVATVECVDAIVLIGLVLGAL
jgi:hypothetical protein